MASRAALSRSRPLMGPVRYDVSPHLVKWWKGVKPDDGQVIRHLSPFEQHPVMPWFKTWPGKVMDRAPNYIIYLGGSLALSYFTIIYCDSYDKAEKKSHRY
mmetsp:Transcript_15170/g.23111  ORF Transcript_15170/g.23111 Transcript_15170/m.23111 type:complete len:101 (-) Transcript_15170:235-537(-)